MKLQALDLFLSSGIKKEKTLLFRWTIKMSLKSQDTKKSLSPVYIFCYQHNLTAEDKDIKSGNKYCDRSHKKMKLKQRDKPVCNGHM